ncbi:hypothetical protein GCM10027405_03270 [Arthrobacter alkaliphilus]|uniref:hypothetical protein n=1 Tax=Arthrobacter alkaliphilus TaxID=369936 RepID=UPI001F428E85|nr:hypothetical protein [Arthrobacter alkaliphilus]
MNDDLPADQPETVTGPAGTRNSRRRLLIILAVALVLVLGLGTTVWFTISAPAVEAADAKASAQASADAAAKKKKEDSDAFWAQVQADNANRAAQQAKDAAARNASQAAEKAAQEAGTSESIRTQMEAQGWTRFSGPYYYQYAPKSEYSCGNLKCSVVHVTTMAAAGCPGGLYVAASIEHGASSVGLANSITAPLAQGKDAIVKLDDTTGQGDGIRLADIHCL